MFGWKLISERELTRDKEYVEKLERLLEHERQRIDFERERADRLSDSLLQSSGLPPASPTVVAEQKHAEFEAGEKRKDYLTQMAEIYSETMDDMLSDESEPEPISVD